jgi:hypothetical protein
MRDSLILMLPAATLVAFVTFHEPRAFAAEVRNPRVLQSGVRSGDSTPAALTQRSMIRRHSRRGLHTGPPLTPTPH